MKQSKFGWAEWERSTSTGQTASEVANKWQKSPYRVVRTVNVGDVLPELCEGCQYFGSGGYSGRVIWQSPDGECPVAVVSTDDIDNGFVSGISNRTVAVRPGVVYHYEADCIREAPFADTIFIVKAKEE